MTETPFQPVTCADCHRTYECTPLDDHYEPAWGGPRVCHRCLLRQYASRPNIAPLVLPTPPEGAAAGEGDGGLSPASPATNCPRCYGQANPSCPDCGTGEPVTHHSKNRGGRP